MSNTIGYTKSNKMTINGRVMPTTTCDNSTRLGREDGEHQMMRQFFTPGLDGQVREIIQETHELRLAGKLRPFVEGEPVGVFVRVKLPRRLSAAQLKKAHNERMQRKQEAMLDHRKRNDTILVALLSKRF